MLCTRYVYNTSDSHLPKLRQLFEDPRRLEDSELIVVQTPRKQERGGWLDTETENNRGDRRAEARLPLHCTRGYTL